MTFLYLNADRMGQGDEALGRKLLSTFLEKLAGSETRVDLVGCVNDAVFLTTREGAALEALRRLASKGARIASCGTCLDHHQLREKLLVGEVGNMDQTIQVFSMAEKVIAPC
ncbi:MAG: hypothetical protein J0L75_17115 [Spirochaetes bacterium]|nr:hypothetical protein [Spirochaetota bacterium]